MKGQALVQEYFTGFKDPNIINHINTLSLNSVTMLLISPERHRYYEAWTLLIGEATHQIFTLLRLQVLSPQDC